jgi:uncharacterized protein (DUF427 family)
MAQSPASTANQHITVTPFSGRVIVTFKGALVADTQAALQLREGSYPATFYIPRTDCKMVHFVETDLTTTCPHKGTARYWTLSSKDGTSENAVWGYDSPFEHVAVIDEHVAFYPNRVDIQATGS